MIKILHIHTLPVISGSGINTFLSMKGMDKSKYQVALACAPGGRLNDLVLEHGMKVHVFRHLVQPLDPVKDLMALFSLTRFLKKNDYQIIHTHNSKAGFIGRLAGKLARIPVIIHTVHGFAFHDQEPFWRQSLFRNLERIASHWCDKMIFISQPLIDWAIRENITRHDKTVKIYSGIDLDKFRPVTDPERVHIREKWGMGPDDEVIGIVSKLWEGKGHAVLIKAFREISKEITKARLVIVGEGYIEQDLKGLVKNFGLDDSVVFTGFQSDVSEIIGTFDVAVLPSFFEGMGRVLLEAMAMKKPLVASNVGGIPDLVKDGINGFLTTPGDVNDLVVAIKKILNNKDLAARMGEEGRRRVTDLFNAETMVRSIETVYMEALGRKGIRVGT